MSYGDYMDSFLDSNVIIGHIFCLDSSFEASKKFIFRSDNNFFSLNVKNEVERTFIRKNTEFDRFLSRLYRKIEHNGDLALLSREYLHKHIKKFDNIGNLDVADMQYAFEKMWEHFGFSENQEAFLIKLKLNDFINNFEGTHIVRKNQIFKELSSVPNHSKKDTQILDKIKKENLRDTLLHGADEDILFDANEFCKNNPELNLKFVSADQNFLKAIDILRDYLCLKESINLVEFSSN